MIRAEDFLEVAEDLMQATTEAAWRSAVSRAYYSAFHKARDLLGDLGFAVPRADQAHAYLWLRLANCGDPGVQVAGSELNRLRRERNRADYEKAYMASQADCLYQVQSARRVLQTLDTCLAEPLRAQITDAMRVYERDVLRMVTWQP